MCKNKNQAIGRIKEIKNGSWLFKKYRTEMELHVYLENNWEKTPFKAEWELCESHYHTDEVGEIDLLARHRKQNKYLVIELKKDRSTDTTVGQILRYMGWIKTEKKAEVEGLIISAARKDKHLDYALTAASNIKLSMYYLENNKPNFHDPETINEIFSEIEKRKHLTI